MTFSATGFAATLLVALVWGSSASGFQPADPLAIIEMVDGTSKQAGLISVNGDAVVFRSVGGAEAVVPADTVSRIRYGKEGKESARPTGIATAIFLIDGTRLYLKSFQLTSGELTGRNQRGARVTLGIRLIDHIRFGGSSSMEQSGWTKLLEKNRQSDALVVLRAKKLQAIEGVVGDVSAQKVSFTVGDRSAEIDRARLTGMMFYRRTADKLAVANCVLSLADGSRLQVRQLEKQGRSFLLRTCAGAKLEIGEEDVSSIDFEVNRAVWLTDLEPATNDWSPLLEGRKVLGSLKQFSRARFDQSFGNKPLGLLISDEAESFRREEFAKGFAIKGGGKLSYLLGGQYRQLTGRIGFDPDANAAGVVKLLIQVDGKNRIARILDASQLKAPWPVNVELVGAERLVFQVQYHDRRSVGDILHAVDMKLHR